MSPAFSCNNYFKRGFPPAKYTIGKRVQCLQKALDNDKKASDDELLEPIQKKFNSTAGYKFLLKYRLCSLKK